jgi:hypothetical protein
MSTNNRPQRYDLTGVDIAVQWHVFERAQERLPGEHFDRGRVRQEVFDAVINGSWSRDKPAWLGQADPNRDREAAYCWPTHMRYAYTVLLRLSKPIVVVTLLTPEIDPLETPLRRGLLNWLRQHGDGG